LSEKEIFLANVSEFEQELHRIRGDDGMLATFEKVAQICFECLLGGNVLYFAGNGGSAAEAQHIAAEFVGRFKLERDGYPAIALTTDTSIITAVANDYSYEEIFSRQVKALVKSGDVIFLLTTSGNSKNLINACEEAKKKDVICVGLTGKGGGSLSSMCDLVLNISAQSTARTQEIHLLLLHSLCEVLELRLTRAGVS
jgi:D-sedoheptulose 7-phosphate isomerase